MLMTIDIDDDSLQARVLRAVSARIGDGVARVDFSEIAKDLGSSRQAVSYNIRKLVRNGVLISHGDRGFSLPRRHAEG